MDENTEERGKAPDMFVEPLESFESLASQDVRVLDDSAEQLTLIGRRAQLKLRTDDLTRARPPAE